MPGGRSPIHPEDQALLDREAELLERIDEDMSKGASARQLLENELLVEAFEAIESRWASAMRHTSPAQVEDRENAWRVLFALDLLKDELTSYVTTGKVAAETADRLKRADGDTGDTH
jgi:hypothetical protein